MAGKVTSLSHIRKWAQSMLIKQTKKMSRNDLGEREMEYMRGAVLMSLEEVGQPILIISAVAGTVHALTRASGIPLTLSGVTPLTSLCFCL